MCVDVFSLTGRTLAGVSVFRQSHCSGGALSPALSLGGGGGPLAPLPRPSRPPQLSIFSHFLASCKAAGEAGGAGPGREEAGRAAAGWLFTGGAGCPGWGWTGG